MYIYIAAPLFNTAEKRFNADIAAALEAAGQSCYLPQRDGGSYADLLAAGTSPGEAARILFAADIAALQRCDMLVMVLDGRVPDEGACVELGYAFARGKRCVGLKTDSRSFAFGDDNLMIRECLEAVCAGIGELTRYCAG